MKGLDRPVDRRSVLAALAGGSGIVGITAALYNSVLGYGTAGIGTNLRDQAAGGTLASLADSSLRVTRSSTTVATDAGEVILTAGTRQYSIEPPNGPPVTVDRPFTGDPPADPSLPEPVVGALRRIERDRSEIESGRIPFEFLSIEDFFERIESANPRPETVGLLRGSTPSPAGPTTVAEFAGVQPTNTSALFEGLGRGFKRHTHYDIPRFVGGAIEDNLLRRRVEVRDRLRGPTDFQSLLESGSTGVFCGELTRQSMAALHAIPASDQSVPVAGTYVVNRRNKHIFTGVASLVRDDADQLRVPMTFIDYTFPVLFDDLGLARFIDVPLDAFDERHRADSIRWWA